MRLRGHRKVVWGWVVVLLCLSFTGRSGEPDRTMRRGELQRRARQAGRVLQFPAFESSPGAIRGSTRTALRGATRTLERIEDRDRDAATFINTVVALDRALGEVTTVAGRARVLREASPDPELRRAAAACVAEMERWLVGAVARRRLGVAVQAVAARAPRLDAEDARLLQETLEDLRRAGQGLPAEDRRGVEQLRLELSGLCAEYRANLASASAPVPLRDSQLEGVPVALLRRLDPGSEPGVVTLRAEVPWQLGAVMDQARDEGTRLAVATARYRLAAEANVPVLRRMLSVRQELAWRLARESWADIQAAVRMAGQASAVRAFLENLSAQLDPAFAAHLEKLRFLKERGAEARGAVFGEWDWRYYENQWQRAASEGDPDPWAAGFPLESTLEALFGLCEREFGLRLGWVELDDGWADDVELCVITDAASGAPLGAVYLDLFAREHKFNHYAHFGVVPGRVLPSGRALCPVVAVLCSFVLPPDDEPAVLSLQEVQTLFHEFGHVLQTVLCRARHVRLGGANGPGDFVEVPAQLLERLAVTPQILAACAADGSGGGVPPADVWRRFESTRSALAATACRRQIAFALVDLELHSFTPEMPPVEPVGLANDLLRRYFLPVPAGSAFVASFAHLASGYDGGYYGYLWADAIAADLATEFAKGPGQGLGLQAGRKFRQEILEPGGTRDPQESLQRLLGRRWSLDPLLRSLGATPPTSAAGWSER